MLNPPDHHFTRFAAHAVRRVLCVFTAQNRAHWPVGHFRHSCLPKGLKTRLRGTQRVT